LQIATSTVEKKIAIGLIGYESIREIARCLDSWVGHIDTMILGDGKFDFYFGENDYSQDGWLEFAEKRYQDKCEVVTYKYAGKQQEKRQKYLDIAGELKCDYLITVDTEEYLHPDYQDWNKFYKQLYHLSEGSNDRIFYQWVWIPDETLWPKQGNKFPSNQWLRSMKIHKDPGTMRYCYDSHFCWCPKDVEDDQIAKWQLEATSDMIGQVDNPYLFLAHSTVDGVRVTMDRTLRTKEQIEKGTHWALQNMHEEKAKEMYRGLDVSETPITVEMKSLGMKKWMDLIDQPHYYDENGMRKIITS